MPNKKDENFEINCISGFNDPIQFFGSKKPAPPRDVIDEPEGIDVPPGMPRPHEAGSQGKPPGAVSLSVIEVQDVICEGPISGLVEGEYVNAGVLGQIGYTSSVFNRHVPSNPDFSFLRSMYYNGTPIIDDANRKNFQAVDVAQTKGTPGGKILSIASEPGLESSDSLEIIKNVGGERLRGPDSRFTNDNFGATEIKPGQDPEGRDNAKFYQITNKNVKGFKVNIKVNSLSKVETEGKTTGGASVGRGDVKGTAIRYKVDYRPVFRVKSKNQTFRDSSAGGWLSFYPRSEEIYGKISSGYIRTTIISLETDYPGLAILNDPDLIGWEIIVYRSTLESFKGSLRNQSFVDSIVEVYEASLSHPNTAVIKHRFRADAFNEIPVRTFLTRLLKVKVPNNYNPILRTYGSARGGSSVINGGDLLLDNYYDSSGALRGATTEIWNGDWKRNSDGTIKYEWTDNPAWVYFDLLTNARYGLGKVLTEKNIDKWTLFEIAKYCDVLVLGENDELEPRFSANVYINTQEDAYSVLNSFASIFRGISIYSGGQLKALSDMPQEPMYTFTNSNVVKGDFNYSSSAKKARSTVCLVRYNDKNDHYKPSVVWDEDAAGIQRYGIQTKELTAFGCTNKGQALRMARWTLASERLETQSISFSAGIEASYLSAGDLISISDRSRSDYKNYESRRKAGRTRSVRITGAGNDYATIELDSSISGFINHKGIPGGSLFNFTLLTPPSYLDPFTANITGSSQTSFVKRSQVQKLVFSSDQVIHSGRSNFDSGNAESFVSIIKFNPNGFSFQNQLNTTGFNVTGFTGALYGSTGELITQTGFVENPPDNFIWSIEYSGTLPDKAIPDKETYKIISVEEREDLTFNINAIEHKAVKYAQIESGYFEEKPEVFPVVPQSPLNILVTTTAPGGHIKVVNTTMTYGPGHTRDFVLSEDNNLGAYFVYYKTGADFISDDFPNFSTRNLTTQDPHFKGTLNRVSTTYNFLPSVEGQYYIRIYPVNDKRRTNSLTDFVGGTSAVANLVDLIRDYKISNLRVDTDEGDYSNLPGTKDQNAEKHFYESDLSVSWQVSPPGDFEVVISPDITARVTYRVPSISNRPNPTILHEVTGIEPSQFYNELALAARMGITVPSSYPSRNGVRDEEEQLYYNVLPLREYDIVVELVNPNGDSSAGGRILRDGDKKVTVDSSYANTNGYDILNLYHPAAPIITLTDRYATPAVICGTEDKFCSSQWMNPDGTVHLKIEKDDDFLIWPEPGATNNVAGFAFLISKVAFTSPDPFINTLAEAGGSLKNSNVFNDKRSELAFSTIELSSLDAAGKSNISALTSFMGVQELYLSVAPIDTLLAKAMLDFPSKREAIRKLRFSNIVKIRTSSDKLAEALIIKAWAHLILRWESSDISYRSAGFSSIVTTSTRITPGPPQKPYSQLTKHFFFQKNMPDTNYSIIHFRRKDADLDSSHPFGEAHDGSPSISFTKYVDHFEATESSRNGSAWDGTYYFMVMDGDFKSS